MKLNSVLAILSALSSAALAPTASALLRNNDDVNLTKPQGRKLLSPICERFIECAQAFDPTNLYEFIDSTEPSNDDICAAIEWSLSSSQLDAICAAAASLPEARRHLQEEMRKKNILRRDQETEIPICETEFPAAYAEDLPVGPYNNCKCSSTWPSSSQLPLL